MVIAVRRTALDESISYPSCKEHGSKQLSGGYQHEIRLLKELTRLTFFRWQVDDAKQITATCITINISKQHAETSYGIKNWGNDWQMRGKLVKTIENCVHCRVPGGSWSPSRPVTEYLNFFWWSAQDHLSTSKLAWTQHEWSSVWSNPGSIGKTFHTLLDPNSTFKPTYFKSQSLDVWNSGMQKSALCWAQYGHKVSIQKFLYKLWYHVAFAHIPSSFEMLTLLLRLIYLLETLSF